LAAFSSYVLALAKKLYKKGAQKILMKLTAGWMGVTSINTGSLARVFGCL
jgi:hypothetical protein